MTAPLPSRLAPSPGLAWEEIEQRVTKLSDLAQSEVSLEAFAQALLDQLLECIPTVGGAVLLLASNSEPTRILASTKYCAELQAGVEIDAARRSEASISVRTVRIGEDDVAIAFIPGISQSMQMDLLLPAGLDATELEGARRLLRAFAEITEDYQRRYELQRLQQSATLQQAFEGFLLRIHGSLELVPTAYVIANDGRAWLGCSRLSVLRCGARRTRVLAISGVDTVDEQSQEVRCLVDLASSVAATNEPLFWRSGSDEEHPPQLAVALHAYLDCSHSQYVAAIPLQSPSGDGQAAGILLAECLQEPTAPESWKQRVRSVARHSEAALGRAIDHDLPLLPLFIRLGRAQQWLKQRSRWAIAAGALALGIVCCLTFIQVDFNVEATGTLQPERRSNVFAPADSVVDHVFIRHGDDVAKGQELLTLRDPQLDFEVSRTTGDLQTTQAKLATIRAKRTLRPTAEGRDDQRDLAAEEEQLKQKLQGLQSQLEVLRAMQKELRVVSPLQGRVLTWNAEEVLEARPVKRGQLLVTVADLQDSWILELRVPDQDMGHVLRSNPSAVDRLPVTFLLTTDPAQTHHGTIDRLAMITESRSGEAPSAAVQVRLADGELVDARAGAGVIAKIHCGRASVGHVWLHEIIDAVRTRLLF